MRFLAFITGAGITTYGAWLAWPPAAFIAGGVVILWVACSFRPTDRAERAR